MDFTSLLSGAGSMFSAGSSILGGIGGIGGGLFGGDGGESELADSAMAAQSKQLAFMNDAYDKYASLYKDYYWPIETQLASNYQDNLTAATPYMQTMRNYQLNRGNELIGLAQETNPVLDENRKSLIQRLTEGEDVLANRYRSDASNDVAASFAQQRGNLTNQMAQYGINPNSGSWASQSAKLGRSEALAQASARTNASRTAEDTSLSRMSQANNYYTTPSMQYSLGSAPTPGLSVGSMIGSGAGGYKSSNGSDMWSSVGSGLGMVGSGLDWLGSSFGGSGSGAGGSATGWANSSSSLSGMDAALDWVK